MDKDPNMTLGYGTGYGMSNCKNYLVTSFDFEPNNPFLTKTSKLIWYRIWYAKMRVHIRLISFPS